MLLSSPIKDGSSYQTSTQEELSLMQIKVLQQKANEMATTLLDSKQVAGGQFKTVLPFENYAIAVMSRAAMNSEQAKEALQKECQYLQILADRGFPVVQVHGDVFEFGLQRYAAVLMEWCPHVTMIEGKHPETVNARLLAMLMGASFPKGEEGWTLHLNRIRSEIEKRIEQGTIELNSLKEKASKLLDAFVTLRNLLNQKGIVIADLQILVGENDNQILRIIDPLAVFYRQNDCNKVVYIDALESNSKPGMLGEDLTESFHKTNKMIADIIQKLEKVIVAKSVDEINNLMNFYETIITPNVQVKNPVGKMSQLHRSLVKGLVTSGFYSKERQGSRNHEQENLIATNPVSRKKVEIDEEDDISKVLDTFKKFMPLHEVNKDPQRLPNYVNNFSNQSEKKSPRP